MKLYFAQIIEWLFPLSDDERILASCTQESFLRKFQLENVHGIIALSSFKDSSIRAAVHLTKFHHHKKAIKLLSLLLSEYLQTLPHGSYVLLPIPLSSKRERERGYNQVAVIAKEALLHNSSIHLAPHVLRKVRHTPPQTSLSKEERKRNLKDAFVARPDSSLHNTHIILLDDVTTTGTTLLQAKRALSVLSPASITCVALSH